MRFFQTSASHTVRPPRGWKDYAWPLGFLGALATVAVFFSGWAARDPGQSDGESRATAEVRIHLEQGGEAGSAVDVLAEAPWSWIQDIRQEVTSRSNLAAVVRELGTAVPPSDGLSDGAPIEQSVEPIRQRLEVETIPSSGPEGTRVRFSYQAPTRGGSVPVVNRLAASFAASLRASWKARAQGAYTRARDELEQAQAASREAAVAVEAFLEERLQARAPGSGETGSAMDDPPSLPAQGPEPPDRAPPLEPPTSRTVGNPDFTAVFAQLQELERRRAEMLVTRTELHPLVRDVTYRIEALERRLAAIPRNIVVQVPEESLPAQAPTPGAMEAEEGGGPGQRAAPVDFEALARLKAAAQDAAERCRLAALAERAAWNRYQQEPQVQLKPARVRRPASSEGVGIGWLLASLVAGLATAAGAGLTATGMAMERPLDSVERIEAVSGAPVVTVITGSGDETSVCAAPRHRPAIRASLILGGLLLVVGCAGIVVRALV